MFRHQPSEPSDIDSTAAVFWTPLLCQASPCSWGGYWGVLGEGLGQPAGQRGLEGLFHALYQPLQESFNSLVTGTTYPWNRSPGFSFLEEANVCAHIAKVSPASLSKATG